MSGREPTLVAFLCRWCSHQAADAAGRRRLEVPAGVRAVRVPCTCRVSPELVLSVLAEGADGVAVLACHPGDCRHGGGNQQARARAALLRRVMEGLGVEGDRLFFGFVAASEARGFAETTASVVARLQELGPLPGDLGGGAGT